MSSRGTRTIGYLKCPTTAAPEWLNVLRNGTLGLEPASPAFADLEELAAAVQNGRLAGAVVPYESLAHGRDEPTVDLLTRHRDLMMVGISAVWPHGKGVLVARLGRRAEGRPAPTGRDRTLLLARLFDQQGILFRILQVIYQHDLNIAHLSNRPDGREGQYFYFDLECHPDEPRFQAAMADLRHHVDPTVELDILGGCPMVSYRPPTPSRALIIGGTHGIGALIGRVFLAREGVAVTVAGRHTQPPYADIVDQFDAVMFAVPLDQTVPVIAAVAPRCRPGTVLVNLASRLAPGLSQLLRSAPPSCEVLGIHTVFGPNVSTVIGKNVVAVLTDRCGPAAEAVIALFRKRGTRLSLSTADRHDRLMQVVQTAWHRFLLAVLRSAARTERPPGDFLNGRLGVGVGGLLFLLSMRLLDNGDTLLWGLQRIDRAAPSEPDAAKPDGNEEFADEFGLPRCEPSHTEPSQGLPWVSANDRQKAIAALDLAEFLLSREWQRFAGAAGESAPTSLTAEWVAGLDRLLLNMQAAALQPADLAGVASPHFLLGLLAGLGSTSARSVGAGSTVVGLTAQTAIPSLLSAYQFWGDMVRSNQHRSFRAELAQLRCWVGPELIAFAVTAVNRVIEELMAERPSLLPRFDAAVGTVAGRG